MTWASPKAEARWRSLAVTVGAVTLAVALADSTAPVSAATAGFDINGYIVGTWRNVDNKNDYVITGSGRSYTMAAGSSRQTAEGCPVTQGQLLYKLEAKQDVGGYLNGGAYLGPWTYIKKDNKGVCQTQTIAPGAPGFYEGTTGFVPISGDKTAENPDGQLMKWFCAYTGPYSQCATLSRIGKGFVGVTTTTTTKPAQPPPTTKTTTIPVAYDLTVTAESIARFGSAEQPDGATNAAQASTFAVDLLVAGSAFRRDGTNVETCPNGLYKWTIDGKPAIVRYLPTQSNFCRFRWTTDTLGPHTVKVSASKGSDGKHEGGGTIEVKDKLIFGLGDSNGSGEGNPPWADSRCNRSAASFESQAAGLLEKADPASSVTFVHLACSGASIVNGMLGEYEGITDPGGPKLRPQLDRLAQIRGSRSVDAVVMSIGINDLGFGDIVVDCIFSSTKCYDIKPAGQGRTRDQIVATRLTALRGPSGLYAKLGVRLRQLGIPSDRVYIAQYFDPTRDEHGRYCNPLIGFDALRSFSQDEARWASERVLTPLNNIVREAAAANGWHFLDGTLGRFSTHGYCASDPWIVRVPGALLRRNKAGPLHATAVGNAANASLTFDAMKSNLR